jgi:hypothetical protein
MAGGWPPATREELLKVAEAYAVHRTFRKISTELNWPYGLVQRRIKQAREANLIQSTSEEMPVVEKLRLQVRTLEANIARIHRENDTAEEIRRRIFALAERAPEPPSWLAREGRPGRRGSPVTVWSDWHWGELVYKDQVGGVNEFTADIARKRVRALVQHTVDLCFHHMGRPHQKYPGIVICLGGDMMTGDIHDELRENAWATPQQSVNELTDQLAGAIDNMAAKFGNVFLPCVVGNHGRGTLKPRAKNRVYTSHEWVIYTNLERYFRKSKRIRFQISSDTDAHFKVFGHRCLLTHGDALGVKGGDGIIGSLGPIMRGALKVGRSEAQVGRDFDTLIIGHWHQLMYPPGVVANGALIGYNEFARVMLRARYEPPAQALFFIHPEYGRTAAWPVFVDQRKVSAEDRNWVTWAA